MNNLLSIDFIDRMRRLMREAFKIKKYKAMNKALAVFSIIAMLPIIITCLVFAGTYFCWAFFYKVMTDPIKALHGLVNSEGKDVRHAPQTVIYIISWPTIFLLYCIEALMIPVLSMIYAVTSVLSYIWTLGGYKFHIFPEKAENIEITVEGKYENSLPLFYVLMSGAILAVVPLLHLLIDYMNFISEYGSKMAYYYYFPYYPIYIGISVVFSAIFSILCLSKLPKDKKLENKNEDKE